MCLSVGRWKGWRGFLVLSLLAGGDVSAQMTVTNGLTFWVKADDGVQTDSAGFVTNWINKAPGGGNDARQTIPAQQPTFVSNVVNGLPVVRFGDLDILRTATPVQTTPTFTMIAVATLGTNSLGPNGFVGPFANGNDTANGYSFRRQAMHLYGIAFPNVAFVNFGPTNTLGFHIESATRNASGQVRFYANGVQSGSVQTPGAPLTPTGNSQVGGSDYGFFLGDVAEVLVYNQALHPDDLWLVHEYLIAKYAIPEPSTAVLLGAGILWLQRHRRHKQGSHPAQV